MEQPIPNRWSARRDRLDAFLETRWSALLVFFLFAIFVLLAIHGRGPFRRATYYKGFTDVLPMYVQTRAWIAGLDPYSEASRLLVWPREVYAPHRISLEYLSERASAPTPYPVFSYVVMVPLALLPWPFANASVLLLDFVLFFVVLRTLAHLFHLAGLRRIVWFAAALAFEPFYAGMDSNNIAVLAVECSLLALGAARFRRHALTALLLALSFALKPQIGFCFFVYFACCRYWRVVAQSVAGLTALTAFSVLRMHWAHVSWLTNYMRASTIFFHAGGINDFRPLNPYNFDLINLQVILYRLLGSAEGAQLLALALGALLFLAWWAFAKSATSPRLLSAACLCAISLLPIYHRFYDATLLLCPLCWYVTSLRWEKRSHRFSLLFWIPFFLPFGALLRWWSEEYHTESWWLGTFVRPAANWCLLALTLFLLLNLYRASDRQAGRHSLQPNRLLSNNNDNDNHNDHDNDSDGAEAMRPEITPALALLPRQIASPAATTNS